VLAISSQDAAADTAVDVEEIGQYYVTFTATDGQGNALNTAACPSSPVRTVNVIDSLKPVIGLDFDHNGTFYHGHVGTHDHAKLGEHDTTGSHPDYGVNMAKAGYADKTKHANPAYADSGFTHLMSEAGPANAWMFAAAASAAVGLALLARTGSATQPELAGLI